jgi:NADH-quinone oxidoreductase subunit A
MLDNYLPILVFLIIGLAVPIVIMVASRIVGMNKPSAVKLAPYECGMPPVGSAHQRFPIKFYIIAMLFIVFDIETVFMFPWAVMFKRLGMFGFIEMGVFVLILVVGYAYVWKKGALEWE